MRLHRIVAVLLGVTAALSPVAAGELVWIEAERFANLGGWTNDAQFVDQMGSPYLLATGWGQPVPDATTRAALPRRTMAAVGPRSRLDTDHHPGRFEVMFNGRSAGTVFGAGGRPQAFQAPPWAYRFPTCASFAPGRHPALSADIEAVGHQWILELGGLRDTYADAEEIRDDLLRLIFGLWDHTKNCCERDRDQAANYRLVWVSHVTGKRENRRLIGDHVLTQNDIAAQTLFDDRVAYGGWTMDDHHSAGFFHPGSFGRHYDDPERACQGLPFSIPFRCLYSRNVENLLMAGRNISATHLALSDTRVMLTCAVIGQAAGTGAALCVEHETTPRGVGAKHIAELQQQLLKDGAYLIDLPNRDPRRSGPRGAGHGIQRRGP